MATPVHRVVDASSLISLAKVGRLELPRVGVPEIVVPEAVMSEASVLRLRRENDPCVSLTPRASNPVTPISQPLQGALRRNTSVVAARYTQGCALGSSLTVLWTENKALRGQGPSRILGVVFPHPNGVRDDSPGRSPGSIENGSTYT